MPTQERDAWFIFIVVVVTLAAYFAFVAFVRFDEVAVSIFAISALAGLPGVRKRQRAVEYDERDRSIERRALLSSLMAFYVGSVIAGLAAGFWRGWETTVPVWQCFQLLWAGLLAVWGVKALATIVLYRKGAGA